MATNARPYVSGNYSLDLDGYNCGIIKSIEGLNTKAEVIRLANAGGYRQNAQLGNLTIEDCKMQVGGMQVGPLKDWIDAALNMQHRYCQGAVNHYNFDLKNAAITKFTDALLTKISFPKLDGSSKDPAYMGIEFAVQTATKTKGDGSYLARDISAKQKQLRTDTFRVVVDKIGPDPCKRINSFEAVDIKMGVTRDQIGQGRLYELVPAQLKDMANLKFTVAAIDCEAFLAWHQDFVIDGNCTAEQETSIEVTYLDQSMKNELMHVTFKNVGIFNLTDDKQEDAKGEVKRITVECYIEDVTWDVAA